MESVMAQSTFCDSLLVDAIASGTEGKGFVLQRFICLLMLIFFGFFNQRVRETAWVLFCVLDSANRAASVQLFLSLLSGAAGVAVAQAGVSQLPPEEVVA
jgi:hypothetical protein